MPPYYPYISTWAELWASGQHDRARPSGAHGDDDDDAWQFIYPFIRVFIFILSLFGGF